MTEIRTPRLLLRRARPADADAMHLVLSDPACMRHWSSAPHADRAETVAWIDAMASADPAASDDFIVTADGRVIGKMGAWRVPEIGFILARDAWGRGLAFEAGAAFLRHAAARGLDHLTADVDPRNAASLRLLDRLGFHRTGTAERTFHIAGEWSDSVYLRRDLRPTA